MREPRCRWQLDGAFALIQQVRLVHAMAESACAEWQVQADQLDKFSILRERFGLHLATARPDDPSLTPITVTENRPPDAVDGGRGGSAAPDLPAGHRRPLPHAVAGRAHAPLLVRRAADRQPPGAPRRLEIAEAFRRRGGAGGEDQLRRLRPPAVDPLAGRRPPAPHRRRHRMVVRARPPLPDEGVGRGVPPVAGRLGARAVSERRLPVVVPLSSRRACAAPFPSSRSLRPCPTASATG